jgi:hypothetical protein
MRREHLSVAAAPTPAEADWVPMAQVNPDLPWARPLTGPGFFYAPHRRLRMSPRARRHRSRPAQRHHRPRICQTSFVERRRAARVHITRSATDTAVAVPSIRLDPSPPAPAGRVRWPALPRYCAPGAAARHRAMGYDAKHRSNDSELRMQPHWLAFAPPRAGSRLEYTRRDRAAVFAASARI